MKPAGRSLSQKTLDYLVDDVPLRAYALAFVLVVASFGWLYSMLSPYGQGTQITHLGFLNGIYFSIVTISSLGYGDLYPQGASKILASMEVLFGLSFMGIAIAKLTSKRLSYHVERLFISDAQKRLDDFTERFTSLRTNLAVSMSVLGRLYQQTPGSAAGATTGADKVQSVAQFKEALNTLLATSVTLANYFASEVGHHNYFAVVPGEPIRRMGDVIEDLLYRLIQLILSLPADAKLEILDVQCRRSIVDVLSEQRRVCDVVCQHSTEPPTRQRFEQIKDTCERVRRAHFETPQTGTAAQPDQRPAEDTNAPQAAQ